MKACFMATADAESSILESTHARVPTYKAVPGRTRLRRNSVRDSLRLSRALQLDERATRVMDIEHLYDCLLPCEPKMGHQGRHNELHGGRSVVENLDAMHKSGRSEAWPFEKPCFLGKYRRLIG